MFEWQEFRSFLDICQVYFAVQFGRCAMLSLGVLGIVMLLRKQVFNRFVFARGMLWGCFLIVPFAGKLKIFYENILILAPFKWWTHICMTYTGIASLYCLGILLMGICLIRNDCRLKRTVSGMHTEMVGKRRCYITDMCVTPFTVGILIPRIVLPQVTVRNYTESELEAVILHEQTHIRLGHLWFHFLWDVLRCLLWPNLLLSVCMKYFRSDMEDICDKVCVQRSGKTAQDYAALLLKTMKLLKNEQNQAVATITYASEKEYGDVKRRMLTILSYKPYCGTWAAVLAVSGILFLLAIMLIIKGMSFSNYNTMDFITLCGSDGTEVQVKDSEKLYQAIAYDDTYVYIEQELLGQILREEGIADKTLYLCFGGFYKLPGIGGGSRICMLDTAGLDGRGEAKIVYDNRKSIIEKILIHI